ncbi:hypothetical protein [Flavobacterium aquatile]|uniref:Outer membrane lipoprotein carrier protein LolA n=1 Tax=Flavobacterium aquatile LMG 4008 = ATCC 11947 TaxID=1453498 RepID=A0A095SV48_9FLAO|nr:hypothetical protein [Flavobacterium aquatile]KGD68244.1 hypothetical protein LG45_08100 [Flavobacterium aquatile LMG 4008 = ATCC 11947]OXA68821.1 hypothetical protein B0A61_03700 [Flavobacterium aquatile LMG 4008 = ATCC 11947]GEC77281.1 hypothetical protein FAQ01_01510 [Flavobacterium aquatile]
MKKLITMILALVCCVNFAQTKPIKIDTLLGSKGIFSKFKPKEISTKQKLFFNVKLTYTMKDKSGKTIETSTYFNTKHGYFGVLNSKKGSETFNPNDKNFNFMVYSHSLKNYIYSTDRKGKKTVMSIPINPKNDFKMDNVTLKKDSNPSKKFTNQNIVGYPYNNSKTSEKDKVIVYLNDNSISGKNQFKNQLSFAGLGFYQIDGKTVLSTSIENNGNIITLTKIEGVAINFNASEFKKEEMEGMDQAVEEMMKNLKKQ